LGTIGTPEGGNPSTTELWVERDDRDEVRAAIHSADGESHEKLW
jgi:hypothetical protein